jgi:hypothetical protein
MKLFTVYWTPFFIFLNVYFLYSVILHKILVHKFCSLYLFYLKSATACVDSIVHLRRNHLRDTDVGFVVPVLGGVE